MKNTIFLLMSLFLINCMENKKNEVDQIWSNILQSQSVKEERINVEKFSSFMAKNHLVIETLAFNSKGESVNINDSTDHNDLMIKFKLRNENNNQFYETKLWKPKDLDNFFIIFRE